MHTFCLIILTATMARTTLTAEILPGILTEDVSLSQSLEDTDNDVVKLTESNFQEIVLQSNEPILVMFFASWCPHSRRLAPEWAKAAKRLKGKVVLASVDTTTDKHLRYKYFVTRVPTIKYFPPRNKRSPEEYKRGHSAQAIINWVIDKVPTLQRRRQQNPCRNLPYPGACRKCRNCPNRRKQLREE